AQRIKTPSASVLRFLFHAEDGIRDRNVTGVQTCALPICLRADESEFARVGTVRKEAFAPAQQDRVNEQHNLIDQSPTEQHRRQRSEERRVGKARRTPPRAARREQPAALTTSHHTVSLQRL